MQQLYLLLFSVALINIAALVSFFRFELDTDFLNFFASDNPKAEEFNRLKDKYETGETILVLIEQNHSLLEKENLLKIFSLQDEIEKLDGVSEVESFIPSEISVRNHIFQVDDKFIDRHSDILEDYIEQNYSLVGQPLSADINCFLLDSEEPKVHQLDKPLIRLISILVELYRLPQR